MRVELTIPPDLHFEDIELSKDLSDGELQVDAAAIARVCEASGYDPCMLGDIEFAMAVLVGWYEMHLSAGGAPHSLLEDFLARPPAQACGGFVAPIENLRCDH